MQNAVKDVETSMVAVIGMELEEIENELNNSKEVKNEICEIANDNCPGQVNCQEQKFSSINFSKT